MSFLKNDVSASAHGMFYLKPAPWYWGRFLRAALCVGLPFAIGLYLNNIMPWMWVAMGTLMMTTGERNVAYGPRMTGLLRSSVLGAAGYLLGYLSHIPFEWTIVVMACIGYAASVLSQKGPNWSIGCLQLLLTASIAIGVPSIANFFVPAGLYLVGALLYVAVLGIEALIEQKSAQKPVTSKGVEKAPAVALPAAALALCLAAAYSSKYFIPENHWFWIPLTVGLIMKPDLGNIVNRSVLRCLGTAVGVLIATAILMFVPKDVWMALFIAVFAGVLPWCMARSYAFQAVVLTPLVLLLVDVIVPGEQNVNYGIQRFFDTLIGASIVLLLGYVFWRVLDVFAKRFYEDLSQK